MKKLLSLLLAAVLMGSLVLPASAADDASARLAKVTQLVKDTLELDTGAYENFQGERYEEELAATWRLNWTDGPEDSSISVEALEDGTIVSYHLNGEYTDFWNGNLPAFPTETDADAELALAEAFLKKVLAPNATAELKQSRSDERLSGSDSFFSGKIKLNGVPSPLDCSLTVKDGKVVHFSQDAPAATFLGEIPSPDASADLAKATADLREKLAVRLVYVLPDSNSKQAVLRYVPEDDLHNFYADAKTGVVLDITALEKEMGYGGGYFTKESSNDAAPTAAAAGADRGLSAAEQAGVEKLSGVLSAEQLDAILRAEEAYGLKDYTLASTSYTLEKNMPRPIEGAGLSDGEEPESDRPVCRIRYVRTEEDESYSRTFNVDARTGEVLYLYSSAPWGRDAVLTEEQARAKAEAFLKDFAPDRTVVFRKTTDNEESKAPYFRFSFSREVNGYPFAANYYNISIDNADGSVCGLDYAWDDGIAFDSPDGVISPEAGKSAWADTYDVTLEYRLVPQPLNGNDPVQARIRDWGMKSYYGLRLTYGLSREDSCQGVDAKTGKPVYAEKGGAENKIAYTDIEGHSAQADIEKLARYGVGYASQEFRPGKVMTQWEFVCLLASLKGQLLDPAAATKNDRDYAYRLAYGMDVLTRAERSENAAVNRGQLVKMLLNAAGYGPAARLTGIYTVSYSDSASIPAGDLGYAAIAQALGMTKETYGANRSASRAEAASMLCRILE